MEYSKNQNDYDDLYFSKRFYVGLEDAKFFKFCLNDEKISQLDFDTGLMEYRDGSVYVKYAIYNNLFSRFQKVREQGYQRVQDITIDDACKINMSVADMARYSNNVIRIISVVNLDEKNRCTDALKNFCSYFKGHPILLEAGYLFVGQYSEYYDTGNDFLLDKLEMLYNKCGFISVNDHIGCYEEQIAMVNNNGSDFIDRYNAIEKEALQKLNEF